MSAHLGIDVVGELDEAGDNALLLGFPIEVERVERNTVPPGSRSREKREKAERLGRGSSDDLSRIDAEMVAENRKFVDQANIDQAKRVLE